MAGIYHNWVDAKAWLNQHYREPDPARLQTFVDLSEQIFANRVRGRVDLPISLADSPDTFAQAKSICGALTAIAFARETNQAEGREDMVWFPDWLEGVVKGLIDDLASPHRGPTDRDEPAAPIAYLPTDGKTADERPAATFTRDHFESGSGTHF